MNRRERRGRGRGGKDALPGPSPPATPPATPQERLECAADGIADVDRMHVLLEQMGTQATADDRFRVNHALTLLYDGLHHLGVHWSYEAARIVLRCEGASRTVELRSRTLAARL